MRDKIGSGRARAILVGLRASIGVGTILAPRLTAKLFGIDARDNPALPYVGRLFGIRELYMVAPFVDGDAAEQAVALRRAGAVDAADAAAALVAGAAGYLPKRAALMTAATAALAVWLGVIARED